MQVFMDADFQERQRQAREAEKRLKLFLETRTVEFNGAGENDLPSVSQAWDMNHLDREQQRVNKETLRGIASILKDYRSIRCEVHGETGAAHSAPRLLARFLQLHHEHDVKSCMDALARARAQACCNALISMGVPPQQLFLTFTGMGGRVAVDFKPTGSLPVPEPHIVPTQPDRCTADCESKHDALGRRTTLRQWGPRHLPPRHGPCVRGDPLGWAQRDVRHAVRKFPRLDSPDCLRQWLREVSRRASGGSDFEVYVRLFCDGPPRGLSGVPAKTVRAPSSSPSPSAPPVQGTAAALGKWVHGGDAYDGFAPHTLSDLLHFDCARLSKLGVCTPARAKALSEELTALRRVVTSEETLCGNHRVQGSLMPDWLFRILSYREEDAGRPPPIQWPEKQEVDPTAMREARSRIQEILEAHSIEFNGAGEAKLPTIAQAWNVEHTDLATRQANLETLAGIAEVLIDLPELRCEIHGETGYVRTAPADLAAHLGKDAAKTDDVKACMDRLAMLRAEACLNALVNMGVPAAQLYATALGQGGKIAVDFIPEGHVPDELRFGHVPLRYLKASSLDLPGWRTLHLAINCHFDPLPHKHCAHSAPCSHRDDKSCDHPANPSVRSWAGKRADYALSAPTPCAADRKQVRRVTGRHAEGGAGLQMVEGQALAAAAGHGGGPRGAYTEGSRSAFYSSTRTPNPHVGHPHLGPLGWKSSLLWQQVSRHRGADGRSEVLVWEHACCLDQAAISRGQADAVRYAESILAALEASEMLWVHAGSDYSASLFTVLELVAWHKMKRIHPSNTVLLNAMQVTSIAGRSARLPLFDAGRDHARWLQATLRKHGSVGRAVCGVFLARLGVDLRNRRVVVEAFAALAAVAASAQQQDLAAPDQSPGTYSTFYAPRRELRAGNAPETTEWDYGWIADATKEGRPRVGKPPRSNWHPGPETEQATYRSQPFNRGPPLSWDYIKPGLVSDEFWKLEANRGDAGGD